MSQYQSVFKELSDATRELIIDMNQKKEPIFILPTKYISKEAAQVGYLLNELSNSVISGTQQTHKSFFCNAANEALQGAIKIMRHYGHKQYKKHQGLVMVYTSKMDRHPQFKLTLDNGIRLYPNIEIIHSLEDIKAKKESVLAIIFTLHNVEELKEIDAYLNNNQGLDLLIGLDLSMIPVEQIWKLKIKAGIDVFIWGEELANREIPFGAFSMTDKIYAPWNKVKFSVLHSSTYNGNILSLKKVLAHVLEGHDNAHHYAEKMKEIGQSFSMRKKYFSTYVNSVLTKLYGLSGVDFDVKKADGCYLTIEKDNKEYQVFDCVGGGGLSIFGHNPDDLPDKVIKQHNTQIDYGAQLEKQLKKQSGYEHFFQTVSGASAVETALLLGLLSQSERRQKILVFKGNYAGKLLLSLSGTQVKASPNHFFNPLYEHVIVVDPFESDVVHQIETVLQKGDIGLIWFEYIRGKDGRHIPREVIDCIEENRQQYGYYVGVDEILAGMCRTGPFMSIEATNLKPDITTISKGLTYMTFPIGAALVREEVWQKAKQKNSEMVAYLKARYQNQIGAHVASHCLRRIDQEGIAENVVARAKQLASRIEVNKNRRINNIEQDGLFFKVVLKKPWWIRLGPLSAPLESLWLLGLVKKWLIQGQFFPFFDTRMFPALNMSEEECSDLADRINQVLNKS